MIDAIPPTEQAEVCRGGENVDSKHYKRDRVSVAGKFVTLL